MMVLARKLDEKMLKLESEGKAKLLERTVYERYSESMPGVFYVHRKL